MLQYIMLGLHLAYSDQLYSVYLWDTSLQSIDLSSLQLIQYGGYVQVKNPSLCYIGNFSHYLADKNSAVCLSSMSPYRLNSSACSELLI